MRRRRQKSNRPKAVSWSTLYAYLAVDLMRLPVENFCLNENKQNCVNLHENGRLLLHQFIAEITIILEMDFWTQSLTQPRRSDIQWMKEEPNAASESEGQWK